MPLLPERIPNDKRLFLPFAAASYQHHSLGVQSHWMNISTVRYWNCTVTSLFAGAAHAYPHEALRKGREINRRWHFAIGASIRIAVWRLGWRWYHSQSCVVIVAVGRHRNCAAAAEYAVHHSELDGRRTADSSTISVEMWLMVTVALPVDSMGFLHQREVYPSHFAYLTGNGACWSHHSN